MPIPSVELVLKDSQWIAGSIQQGYIRLSSPKDIQAPSSVQLSFIGSERSSVGYEEPVPMRNGKCTIATRTANSKRSLVNISIPAVEDQFSALVVVQDKTCGRVVKAGNHRIPFELHIPANLPRAMSVRKGRGGGSASCDIHYVLKAVVSGYGHDEVSIRLRAKPMDTTTVPPSPYNHAALAPQEAKTGFFKKNRGGIASFGARVQDTRMAAGSQCPIEIVIGGNNSHVKQVRARLIQSTTWIAGGGDDMIGGHAAGSWRSVGASRTVASLELDDIQSLCKKPAHTKVKKQRKDRVQDETTRLKEIMSSSEEVNTITTGILSLPDDLLETYQGELLKVTYRIELELQTPRFVGNNQFIEIPVFIAPSFPKEQQHSPQQIAQTFINTRTNAEHLFGGQSNAI